MFVETLIQFLMRRVLKLLPADYEKLQRDSVVKHLCIYKHVYIRGHVLVHHHRVAVDTSNFCFAYSIVDSLRFYCHCCCYLCHTIVVCCLRLYVCIVNIFLQLCSSFQSISLLQSLARSSFHLLSPFPFN